MVGRGCGWESTPMTVTTLWHTEQLVGEQNFRSEHAFSKQVKRLLNAMFDSMRNQRNALLKQGPKKFVASYRKWYSQKVITHPCTVIQWEMDPMQSSKSFLAGCEGLAQVSSNWRQIYISEAWTVHKENVELQLKNAHFLLDAPPVHSSQAHYEERQDRSIVSASSSRWKNITIHPSDSWQSQTSSTRFVKDFLPRQCHL